MPLAFLPPRYHNLAYRVLPVATHCACARRFTGTFHATSLPAALSPGRLAYSGSPYAFERTGAGTSRRAATRCHLVLFGGAAATLYTPLGPHPPLVLQAHSTRTPRTHCARVDRPACRTLAAGAGRRRPAAPLPFCSSHLPPPPTYAADTLALQRTLRGTLHSGPYYRQCFRWRPIPTPGGAHPPPRGRTRATRYARPHLTTTPPRAYLLCPYQRPTQHPATPPTCPTTTPDRGRHGQLLNRTAHTWIVLLKQFAAGFSALSYDVLQLVCFYSHSTPQYWGRCGETVTRGLGVPGARQNGSGVDGPPLPACRCCPLPA